MAPFNIPRGFLCETHGRKLIDRDRRLGDGTLLIAEYMYKVLEDERFFEMVGGSLESQTRIAYWLNKILPACCWLSPDARMKAYNAAIGLWPSAAVGGQVHLAIGIKDWGFIDFDIPDHEFDNMPPSELSRVYFEPMLLQLREAWKNREKKNEESSAISSGSDPSGNKPSGSIGSA